MQNFLPEKISKIPFPSNIFLDDTLSRLLFPSLLQYCFKKKQQKGIALKPGEQRKYI
jgi:hypothetical protein